MMSHFSLDSAAVVTLTVAVLVSDVLPPPLSAAGHVVDNNPTMLTIITVITGIPNTSEIKNEFLHLQPSTRTYSK